MNEALRLLRRTALPILAACALSACALGRSTVDIKSPTSATTNATGFAKITSIQDLRQFEAAPSDAGTPSLENASDITNKAITSRAIARKRGGFGAALGDIVLPEGKTVAGLVHDATQKALQDKGYQVVDNASPQYAAALPLSIDINEFWAWFSPGAFTVTLRFKSSLKLSGDALVGADAPPVTSFITNDAVAAFESTWADLVTRGLADLSDKIAERIRPPPGAVADSGR